MDKNDIMWILRRYKPPLDDGQIEEIASTIWKLVSKAIDDAVNAAQQ